MEVIICSNLRRRTSQSTCEASSVTVTRKVFSSARSNSTTESVNTTRTPGSSASEKYAPRHCPHRRAAPPRRREFQLPRYHHAVRSMYITMMIEFDLWFYKQEQRCIAVGPPETLMSFLVAGWRPPLAAACRGCRRCCYGRAAAV